VSDESSDLRWFAADALPADCDRSVRDLVAAALPLAAARAQLPPTR
jgi:hypothetical protein